MILGVQIRLKLMRESGSKYRKEIKMSIMPKMYIVRYGHLDKILVDAGDHLKPAIAWGGKVAPASKIGTQGDSGISTGSHLHIGVVEVPYDPEYVYTKYTQTDMYNGTPRPSKKQLDLFVDSTLFEAPFKITTGYNDPEYLKKTGRHHPSYNVTSLGNKTIYWNRSFAGRVVAVGYDDTYGNYVIASYVTLEFDSYKRDFPKDEPKEPIKIDQSNDLSKSWVSSAGGYMYHMKNSGDIKSTYGQSSLFDGKTRYIKVHPNNLGIIDSMTTITKTGYAGINGTFFWYVDTARTDTYPTSILQLKDKTMWHEANHHPYPQGVFCYYRDGSFGIEQLKYTKDLSKQVWWAIGGIEYVRGSRVTYNMSAEGFVGKFADVHRDTQHSSIGITKDGMIMLVRHWSSSRAECAMHMRGLGCVYAVGLDGGGSTQYATPTVSKLSSRRVDHLLVARDLKL